MAAGLVTAVALGAGLMASETPESSGNPYGGIVERNVFALKDPPPVEKAVEPNPPPKFYLTGITTILGPKVAMFRAIPTGGKGADASKEESYMLSEGQRQGDVEVVNIDETAGMVKIMCAGTAMTLDFTNNAAKTVAVAAPPGARGGGAPALSPPGMPAHPGFRQTGEPGGVRRSIRTGGQGFGAPVGGGMTPGVTMGGVSPGGFGGVGGVPGSVAPGVNSTAPAAPNVQMSREEQALLIEAMRAETPPGTAPPLPPTMFTHAFQGGNEPTGGGATGPGIGVPANPAGPGVPPPPPTPY